MFLYEKFLKENFNYKNTLPRPYKKGCIVYKFNSDENGGGPQIVYISYVWSVDKGPNVFSYKRTFMVKKNDYKLSDGGSLYVNFDDHAKIKLSDFFQYWKLLSKNLRNLKNLFIASSIDEYKLLMWRNFVICNEYYFAEAASKNSLPYSFYQIIDDNFTDYKKKTQYLNDFFVDFRSKFPIIYSKWSYFYNQEMEEYFCDWFKDFYEQNL